MAQLLVRKIDESLVATLRRRAADNGRSVEEEHRLILREVLTGIGSSKGRLSLEEYLIDSPMEELDLPLPARQYPPAASAFDV